MILAFINAFAYAILASKARGMFGSPRAIGIFNRAGGAALIGAGLAAAVTARTARP